MNLKQSLDEFAKKLITKASEKNTPLAESTDAFKAVTAYYAAQQKGRKKSDDDEPPDTGFSFADGDEVTNGRNPQVRTRRDS